MNKTFKQYLSEAPIGDYKTFGDWDKKASFHSKRDRTIIRHPRAIEITKKKFNNNHHIFNLYFLNHKESREDRGQFAELGRRDLNWVRQNLGDEVANAVEPNVGEEGHVNVIFTNNDGDERKAMTAWMMAHRIAHACARYTNNGRGRSIREFPSYGEAANTIASTTATIMGEYGIQNYPDRDEKLTGLDGSGYRSDSERQKTRHHQQVMLKFFQSVCTFKSARDNNIRDWFEILHELFAQYITTGKIKFNPPPKSFGSKQAFGNGTGTFHLRGNIEDVAGDLNSLANTLIYYFDEMLDDVGDSILIM